MSDLITKCKGDGCIIKEKCYRYTAKGSKYQSYFHTPPFEITGSKKHKRFKCDFYMDESAKFTLKYLQDIVNGKKGNSI